MPEASAPPPSLSVRRKELIVLRGPVDLAAVWEYAVSLVAAGAASETALDRGDAGPLGEEEQRDGGIAALLHVYDADASGGAPGAWGLLAGLRERVGGPVGIEGYGILERVVFDRRVEGADAVDVPGWIRFGTQIGLPGRSRDDFVRSWGIGHAGLVSRHHPGVARYVQSFVRGRSPHAPAFDGAYESTFLTAEDWSERLFDSAGGRRALEADADGFLDPVPSERRWLRRRRALPDWGRGLH